MPTVRVTNGSAQTIAISHQLPQKTEITVLEPGQKADLAGKWRFTILREGKAQLYDVPRTEMAMLQAEGWGPFVKNLLKFVYAEDGCVYLVPPGHDAALKLDAVQPVGFPLCPTAAATT